MTTVSATSGRRLNSANTKREERTKTAHELPTTKYSIGKGENDLFLWGHVVLALHQIVDMLNYEIRPEHHISFRVDPDFVLLRLLEAASSRDVVLTTISTLQRRLKSGRSHIKQLINALRVVHMPSIPMSPVSSYDSTIEEIREYESLLQGERRLANIVLRPGYTDIAEVHAPAFLSTAVAAAEGDDTIPLPRDGY